jgi:Cu(I)/Ag(I) efflux system membrane protein CusA/SilA
MNVFGVTANILSLGGIALAIGDVVDPGIVMAENAYRSLTNRVLAKDKLKPSIEPMKL